MKRLLLILSFSLVLSFGAEGQAPPPPPPLVYSPPDKSEIEVYSPPDKSFRVEFPGKPVTENREFQSAKIVLYRAYRKGSNSSVAVTEHSEDWSERSDEAFTFIKDRMLDEPRSRLDGESEVVLDGRKGKEFRINLDFKYRIVRIFIVEKRTYEIQTDVVNWHILGEKVKDQWRSEAMRFFNSFKIN